MKYQSSNVSTKSYEPFMVNERQAGEVHWLRNKSSTGEDQYSGLWRSGPLTFEYVFPGDEILHALEGESKIEIKDGDTLIVRKGDIVAFDKGVESVWTIEKEFLKFFVIV